MAHVVAPTNLSQRLAIRTPLESFRDLVPGQLRLPTETDTTGLRTGAAIACTRQDQRSFKLGQSAEDRQHQSTMGSRRVGPSIAKGTESGAFLGNRG
jgi:hypothetical protein